MAQTSIMLEPDTATKLRAYRDEHNLRSISAAVDALFNGHPCKYCGEVVTYKAIWHSDCEPKEE